MGSGDLGQAEAAAGTGWLGTAEGEGLSRALHRGSFIGVQAWMGPPAGGQTSPMACISPGTAHWPMLGMWVWWPHPLSVNADAITGVRYVCGYFPTVPDPLMGADNERFCWGLGLCSADLALPLPGFSI